MTHTTDTAKIKRWREERQWSQDHLAALAGIGPRTLQRVEKGDPGSRETLKALAAAFEVDVVDLTVNAGDQSAESAERALKRTIAGGRLSLYIHLASYLCGMVVFAGISLGIGGEGYAMLWPTIWWTVGLACHTSVVAIVELATRFSHKLDQAEQ